MNNWYIINTKPSAEFRVINYLNSKDIKTFMPKLLVTRKHARKVEKVFRPLFPGYIFINTNIQNYENKIILNLKRYNISFICLAGYMKIISSNIIRNYPKKIINIHPSLLPKFKGLNTFSRVLQNNEKKTGCTVHYVNAKLDSGNTIVQKTFFISANDNELTLKEKTQTLEYKAFPEAIIKIFRNT